MKNLTTKNDTSLLVLLAIKQDANGVYIKNMEKVSELPYCTALQLNKWATKTSIFCDWLWTSVLIIIIVNILPITKKVTESVSQLLHSYKVKNKKPKFEISHPLLLSYFVILS